MSIPDDGSRRPYNGDAIFATYQKCINRLSARMNDAGVPVHVEGDGLISKFENCLEQIVTHFDRLDEAAQGATARDLSKAFSNLGLSISLEGVSEKERLNNVIEQIANFIAHQHTGNNKKTKIRTTDDLSPNTVKRALLAVIYDHSLELNTGDYKIVELRFLLRQTLDRLQEEGSLNKRMNVTIYNFDRLFGYINELAGEARYPFALSGVGKKLKTGKIRIVNYIDWISQ